MMLPHPDLLLLVHGPPVPEEGAVAKHARVALRPVLGLRRERNKLVSLAFKLLQNFYLNSVDGEVPFDHLRVLAEGEDGLLPVAVPHPGHFVAVAVQLVDGALPSADVPNEDRRVEAAGKEPRAITVPAESLYQIEMRKNYNPLNVWNII